jgi:deoxyhypusine monooxygenase
MFRTLISLVREKMESPKIPPVSEFGSVDPAPAENDTNISHLMASVVNEEIEMFHRMRAVFALRNIRTDESALALCKGFEASSALLRHEIAYVLGQMQNPVVLPHLIGVLSDENEHVMVRHEAAEAMGAIGDRNAIPTLEKFREHSQPEISESCVVALDLMEWVQSSEFEETAD